MTEPTDVIAYKEGVKLFREGKVLEALARFKFAAQTGEDRPMEHFALASAFVQVQDWAAAGNEYRKFLAMNPGLPQQEAAAGKALKKIEEQIARDAQLEAQAAQEEEQRKRQEALARVRKVFDEAVAYYRAGGYSSALERLESLLASWGRTAEVLNLVGLCHVQLGNHDQAVQALEEGHSQDPENSDVSLNLARVYFERGNSKAADLLEAALERNPRNSRAWFNLAVLRLAQSDFAAAAAAWEKTLQLDPDDLEAKANLDMVKRRA